MATYKDKQKRAYFESFANTIFTGIREIKPEYAEKRAIWELFQNALDTIDKNGEIEIRKTEKGFLFKHNGKHFSDLEFGGLIKQFSVGKKYGDNKDKIGQYGTGFISTHVYGKIIEINTSIESDEEKINILNDFILDRSASTPELLTDKLLEQDELLEKLIDENQESSLVPLPFTSFEYLVNESKKIHIENMFDYIKTIIPYIFCFNNKLISVKIYDGKNDEIYESKPSEINQILLLINNKPYYFPYIQSKEQDIKIILGSKTIDLTNIPKLFLCYPLMETYDVGYNFLIHADDFKPNKERDYLHMEKDNIELQSDVETNEKLLKAAFQLVSNKIKTDENIDFWEACKIRFTERDSSFEEELKMSFVNDIKVLKRLKVDEEFYSINSFEYFDISILEKDYEIVNAIYSLLSQFKKLPSFDLYCEISDYVNNWDSHVCEKFKKLTLENIGEIVVEECSGHYSYIQDKEAYKIFIKEISPNISLLNKSALVPDINGCFRNIDKLVKWDKIESELIDIANGINCLISEKYLHEEFYFIENVSDYNREKFKDDFSKFCNQLNEDFTQKNNKLSLAFTRKEMLLQYTYNFIALNKITDINIKLADFYKRIFDLESQLKQIENPTIDINYQPAFKLLANLYINSLKVDNIENKLNDLHLIISLMFKNTNLKDELLHKLPCIPNQNFKLKSQSELKRDNIKDKEFKIKHSEIVGGDVLEELVLENFEEFLQHDGTVSGNELGNAIEIKLNSERRFVPVSELGKDVIDEILKIIEKISEKPSTWGQWLPNINRYKEEILMHKFQNNNTRSSLFSILTKDEETIGLLGDLAKVENLEDLVAKGKEKQRDENRKNNHLRYINEIGLKIQNLIQEQLDKELVDTIALKKLVENSEFENKEEQNGQDFIIYKNNKPIFFIEVKSKWDKNGRFALSKNQTEKCAKEKNRYAVITVNIEKYKKTYQIDSELNIDFKDLNEFVKVNDDLGDYFENLVKNNILKSEEYEPKLIEYRGSIPQKIIDAKGIEFEKFVLDLIVLMNNA